MKKKISAISALHYAKLTARSMLFLSVLIFYILNKLSVLENFVPLLTAVWIFFVVEMIIRFFPSKLESMGCQKQFKRNYIPREDATEPKKQPAKVTALVATL